MWEDIGRGYEDGLREGVYVRVVGGEWGDGGYDVGVENDVGICGGDWWEEIGLGGRKVEDGVG